MSSPDKKTPALAQAEPKKSILWRIALESATALCIGVILAFLWPKIVGEELSTRGHARLYAPFAGKFYGADKRDQTSVLLIDNAALTDAGEAWPPHYSYHARLLRALARYHPRAVFLDIYFSEIRDDPTLAALTKSLCALHEQGTQVFLGVSPDATGSAKLRPELESMEGKCFETVALQYSPDRLDRLAWTYPLENEDEKNKYGEILPSAALAIYRQALGHQLEVKDNELALTWGLPPATYGLRWLEAAGKKHQKEAANELYCRQDFGVLELAPAFIKNRQHNDAEKPVCVFHETLYANDLATSSEQEEAVLKQLLEGKVVMVGTALSGGGDRVLSPLHGRIPGVYLHAMALDNLLSFGHRYPRDLQMELKVDLSHFKLFLFLVLSLSIGLIFPKAAQAYWKESGPGPWHRRVDRLRDVLQRPFQPLICWLRGPESDRKKETKKKRVTPKLTKKERCICVVKGLLRSLLELIWVLCKLALAMIVVCAFIAAGQHWFSIGLMSVVDIVFFTFAAEWFELNEKLLKKLGMGKSED